MIMVSSIVLSTANFFKASVFILTDMQDVIMTSFTVDRTQCGGIGSCSIDCQIILKTRNIAFPMLIILLFNAWAKGVRSYVFRVAIAEKCFVRD